MAPISNFNVTLSSNGLNYTTSDPNFQNDSFSLAITQGNGSKSYYGGHLNAGVGSTDFSNFGFTSANQPVFPLTIDIIFDDNNSGSFGGSGDRVWKYHITSTSNDINDTNNVLNDGPFIDVTATDRVILAFDDVSPPVIEELNGDNYFRVRGTIENYDALVQAHGEILGFNEFTFSLENDLGSNQVYIANRYYGNQYLTDNNSSPNAFDFSFKLHEELPDGIITTNETSWANVSFQNYGWMYTDMPYQQVSIDYDVRPGADIIDPTLTINSITQGNYSFSHIISGNVSANGSAENIDSVLLNIGDPNGQGYNLTQILTSDLISDNGDFQVEFVPKEWNLWYQGNVDVLHSAIVESSWNRKCYS